MDSVEYSSTVTPDRSEVSTVQSHFRRRTQWRAVKAEHFFCVRKLDLFLKLWSRKKHCLPVGVQFVMKRWTDFRRDFISIYKTIILLNNEVIFEMLYRVTMQVLHICIALFKFFVQFLIYFTKYKVTNFSQWPPFLRSSFLFWMILGDCGRGSKGCCPHESESKTDES